MFLSFLFRNLKPLAIICCCTTGYVSDLDGNPKDRFSYGGAHIDDEKVAHQ